ncbi:[protein-PII] uridylyltransferase family protein [Neorhodopirellula pilleata]|uniref:Glutamate-ammonia-ligase adenylyltransferase n=1 Tax=Neorhodopirellula pilleata TaxID=2714738 RepID=A0A5C5ZQ31_9BACT|nr:glutamate-ammonia-ligase adenylyltransferase [Neorhodopirellula pilleata]TWT89306.1 Glutamate-ammonia-ligase adenylyltransferase [Neorhodopirellula pilleata]
MKSADHVESSGTPQPETPWAAFEPLSAQRFSDPDGVLESLRRIARSGASSDLLANLWHLIHGTIPLIDAPEKTIGELARFIDGSRSPMSLLALFDRDAHSLPALMQVLSTSESIAELLISDPESFDLLRASDGQPSSPEILMDELSAELQTVGSVARAAVALRRFAGREMLRIAYSEFVRGLSPDRVGRQISYVTDAILNASLRFTIDQVSSRHAIPQRIDGTQPTYAIVALGNYGGEEIGYDSPLDLLMLCDQIDRKNESHLRFNRQVASGLIGLLNSNRGPVVSLNLNFIAGPGEESHLSDSQRLNDWARNAGSGKRVIEFHDAHEAAAHYERENQTWQRLAFVKARVVAGDDELGRRFLKRIEPWVYHRLLTRSEISDIRVLRRKLEKRAMSPDSQDGTPIADSPGGRRDIELIVQFLQLLHGGELPEVRVTNTLDAIAALSRHGCLTIQEATILSDNHARLCRLEHHLAVLFDHRVTHLPDDPDVRRQLAWRLGVRRTIDDRNGIEIGDIERFETLLSGTFEVDRKIINHLLIQDVAARPISSRDPSQETPASFNDVVEIETELILDPDPDLQAYQEVLRGHGFEEIERAVDHLAALSHETVSFLSPRRCRHFFASVAPGLLREIAQTPAPDQTLSRLVEVTDSIGAKATLWELLGSNRATLQLMVRLCALAPYLTNILRNHPGMIDELIDSLVMNRLPTAQRLDAQTIRLCGSAEDIRLILQTFKTGSHLMIGVRDLLNKESFDDIGQTLSDTAEACLRRVIENQQEKLASRFGDPVDGHGNPAEMVAIALGKFGGREPNYHSDLDLTFVYTADGETVRRVGGPRTTLSNRQFFNQLAQNVIREIDSETNRLYEIDLPFARGADETVLTDSLAQFLKPFRHGSAPLWQRVALCQARPVSGSKAAIKMVEEVIDRAILQTPWRESDVGEMKSLRQRSESTATPDNLKRGVGGTVDVQCIVAVRKLKRTQDQPPIKSTGIIDSLRELTDVGVYEREDAETLIEDYRYLRNVEAKLRLINTVSRHELPLSQDGDVDTLEMQMLARLLDESDPRTIVARCEQARRNIRQRFERLVS